MDMPALAASTSPGKSQDLAGQVQKALVQLLQNCSHAVVLIQGIEAMPPRLLPVFINGLSEEGKFMDVGQDVHAFEALFIATIVMPTGELQQVTYQPICILCVYTQIC